MVKKIKIAGLEMEVHSEQYIRDSGTIIVAIRLTDASQPLESNYVPGTRAGFPCSVCSQDCILAPSGQRIAAFGKNPVMCLQCASESAKAGQ